MGIAAKDLVSSFVDNLLMPLITPLIPESSWETAILYAGPFELKWGLFVAMLIEFLIIAVVVFLIAKKVLKEEKVKKR